MRDRSMHLTDRSYDAIRCAISEAVGIPMSTLLGRGRKADVCFKRHLAYYIIREQTSFSYPQIGDIFYRDHSTVMYGHEVVRDRALSSPWFRASIQQTFKTFQTRLVEIVAPCDYMESISGEIYQGCAA